MRYRRVLAGAACAFALAAPAQAQQLNPDGSLAVATSLQPLPPVAAGQPIYPHVSAGGRRYAAFGVNDNVLNLGSLQRPMTPQQGAQAAAAVGASFIRIDAFWPEIEPSDDAWSFGGLDAQYAAFLAEGVRPMWIINRTPSWAVGPDKSSCSGNHCMAVAEPAQIGELTEFAAKLAQRYPLAAGLEFHNEPNLAPRAGQPAALAGDCRAVDGTWFTPPSEYVRGLQAFAQGVRSQRPDLRIWGGALSNCLGRGEAYAAEMLALGAAQWISALSWHPYDDWPGPTFDAQVASMEQAVSAYPQLRLLAGEVGVSLSRWSQAQQTAKLQAQFAALGPDGATAGHRRYDAFVGFNLVAGAPNVDAGFGWLGPRTLLNRFLPRRVYCDWRARLGVTRPLPSFVLGCF